MYKYLEQYLVKNISPKCRNIITTFRVSAHKLSKETGRFDAVAREDRTCSKCNLNDVEDEYHFISKCPYYNDLRLQYIYKSNRKAMNRNWSNQNANPALKTKAGNK